MVGRWRGEGEVEVLAFWSTLPANLWQESALVPLNVDSPGKPRLWPCNPKLKSGLTV